MPAIFADLRQTGVVRAITPAFHIARTQNNVLSTTGRFSDLRLTVRLLPIPFWGTVDDSLLGFPIFWIGADAYSGATVADFHRVPV